MTTLADEARYVHDCFFSQPLDQTAVDRYVAANQLCFPQVDKETAAMVDRIISNRLDLEAIELVIRLRNPDNILTRKVQVLFYLVEVRSSYYKYFVNQEAGFTRALRHLAGSALGTGIKYLKGRYLVFRYNLV